MPSPKPVESAPRADFRSGYISNGINASTGTGLLKR